MKNVAFAIALAIASASAAPAIAAPGCAAVVGGICLSKAQAAIVRENFTFLRLCPNERQYLDPSEKGGDCTGGQSGTPAQYGG